MSGLEEAMARASAIRARLCEMVEAGARSRAFRMRDGSTIVVSPDASKPGRWRATHLDADGEPLGHMEAADFRGALEAAWHAGADMTESNP